jgi:hypothetical protein
VSRDAALEYSPEWLNDLNPLDEQRNKVHEFFTAVAQQKLVTNNENPWHQTTEGKLRERLLEHWNAVIDDPASGLDRNDAITLGKRLDNPAVNDKLRDMTYERLRNDPEALSWMEELGMNDALSAIMA